MYSFFVVFLFFRNKKVKYKFPLQNQCIEQDSEASKIPVVFN